MKISHAFVILAAAAAAAVLGLGAVSGWALGTLLEVARPVPPPVASGAETAVLADDARRRAAHLAVALLEVAVARGEPEAAALAASTGAEIDALVALQARLGEPDASAAAGAAADLLQAIAERRATDAAWRLHAEAAQQALQKAIDAATAMRQTERATAPVALQASVRTGDRLLADLHGLAVPLRLALASPVVAERHGQDGSASNPALKRAATRLVTQAASARPGLEHHRQAPPTATAVDTVRASLVTMLASVDRAAVVRQSEAGVDRSAATALARLQASLDAQSTRTARRRADDAERQAAGERQRAAAVDASASTAKRAVAASAAALVAALGLAAWRGARRVGGRLRRAVEGAESMARGEAPAGPFAEMAEPVGRDETSRLLAALRALDRRLDELAGEARRAAAEADAGASRQAAGQRDLGRCAELRAAHLRRTNASIGRLADSVTAGAAASRRAADAAAAAGAMATRGQSLVDRMTATMGEIEASSNRIADITAVVDRLAFQTRLLALNAAVEAARAGPQGRGFAVVASEVRTLADKSAAAADEIKLVVGASCGRIRAGATGARAAGVAMAEVVAQLHRSGGLIDGMAEAGTVQSQVLAELRAELTALGGVAGRVERPGPRPTAAGPNGPKDRSFRRTPMASERSYGKSQSPPTVADLACL